MFKGAPSGLRPSLSTQYLQMMKNAFYITLTALFVLKLFLDFKDVLRYFWIF